MGANFHNFYELTCFHEIKNYKKVNEGGGGFIVIMLAISMCTLIEKNNSTHVFYTLPAP